MPPAACVTQKTISGNADMCELVACFRGAILGDSRGVSGVDRFGVVTNFALGDAVILSLNNAANGSNVTFESGSFTITNPSCYQVTVVVSSRTQLLAGTGAATANNNWNRITGLVEVDLGAGYKIIQVAQSSKTLPSGADLIVDPLVTWTGSDAHYATDATVVLAAGASLLVPYRQRYIVSNGNVNTYVANGARIFATYH